jgi:hypothetical protein
MGWGEFRYELHARVADDTSQELGELGSGINS